MTIIHPETDGLLLLECAKCESTEFYNYGVLTKGDKLRIKRTECIICGDMTDFVPAPPEEFN